jgi:hypothetical protein
MKADNNHNQSRSEEMHYRTKRKRARRWDAILIGIGYSIAFVLILTKVTQTTPCEVINYFNIDTKTCDLIGNADTTEGRLTNLHGLGFNIIFQYRLLTLELSDELMRHMQQFLHNVGLDNLGNLGG